jgi:hypothetical protein
VYHHSLKTRESFTKRSQIHQTLTIGFESTPSEFKEVVLFVQSRLYVSIFGYVTCTTVDAFSAIRGTSFCGLRDLVELELVEVVWLLSVALRTLGSDLNGQH